MNLYLDESGARHPDKDRGRDPHYNYDWFGIGGVLLDQRNEDTVRELHRDFCQKFNLTSPLRSTDIRAKKRGFSFLGKLDEAEQQEFYEELYQLMATVPVLGFGCVVDRPGYKARYDDIYGENKWSLCKSAFSIVVERAAKYAFDRDMKLRVFIEKSGKKEERMIESYYKELKSSGAPFDNDNSKKYVPMEASLFQQTLYDLKFKMKSSPITQLADLYLWPMCIGGYDNNNRPYRRLLDDNKLIDCHLDEETIKARGIKYYCWEIASESIKARKTGP